jgi:hypothetical protein
MPSSPQALPYRRPAHAEQAMDNATRAVTICLFIEHVPSQNSAAEATNFVPPTLFAARTYIPIRVQSKSELFCPTLQTASQIKRTYLSTRYWEKLCRFCPFAGQKAVGSVRALAFPAHGWLVYPLQSSIRL